MIGWKMFFIYLGLRLLVEWEDERLLEREHIFILFHEIEGGNLPLNHSRRERSWNVVEVRSRVKR